MQRPTGGPKDSLPPVLLGELPENLTRNFTAKEIVLTFDEFIKLNNQFKEFSISPDVEKQPDYRVRKKKLHIILPDSLEKNTTYTINFGEGLVDYNEGNPIVNYTYVFATGPELDSLTLSGRVINAYTQVFDEKEDKDVKVLLIPTRQDSIFGKRKANIFTTVDTSGNFQFRNLREDTYRIYALKEQNNDRIYNHPDELLGFLLDSIVLDQDVSGIHLVYSKGKPQQHRTIEKKIEKDGTILLTFNQQLNHPSLRIIDPVELDKSKAVRFTRNNDSAFVYLEKLEFDSIKMELRGETSVLDTVFIRRNKNDKYEKELVPIININNKVDKTKHIRLTSRIPITAVDKNKIILMEDTLSRRNFQLQQDTVDKNLYHIRYNWKPQKNYELTIQEQAVTSAFGHSNKEVKRNFTLEESDNYGDIIFTLNGLEKDTDYIIQLIDENKKNIFDSRTIRNEKTVSYLKFPGAKYTIRIFKDLNGNGRWDGANYFTKTQAEPIWYLDKTFTIRANWEQNETLNVKFD
ncbi:MAG TPA: Ig-like domain-containing protein [Sphingobacterium sp.]|nr:Ig-like domain-containing protein [Sphingobacterium sp.]